MPVLDAAPFLAAPPSIQPIVNAMAADMFRATLDRPGFAAADLGPTLTPTAFRSLLLGFAAGLDAAYQRDFGRRLTLRSVGRFSQRASTETHLDGAPEESILMLGYEPTEVESSLTLYDYTAAAQATALTPRAFLDAFNPTFADARASIAPYATTVTPFDRRHYRVVVINNSSLSPDAGPATGMLGVLHQGTVLSAPPDAARHVNTLMMSPAPLADDDVLDLDALRAYVDSGTFTAR